MVYYIATIKIRKELLSMSYVDFVYKKWLVDVAKGVTNLNFEEYFALFNK